MGRGIPVYFVQDFEPLFYPMGSDYLLAENTYRKGLYHITTGAWCEGTAPTMPCPVTTRRSEASGPGLCVTGGTRCDAVLMGEVFMTSADPAETLRRLVQAARG